jgi:hypothetical protein
LTTDCFDSKCIFLRWNAKVFVPYLSAVCLGGKLPFSVSSCVFQKEQINFLGLGYAVNLKDGHVGGEATDDWKNFFSEHPPAPFPPA